MEINIAMNSCMGAYEFNIKGIKLFAFLFLKKKKNPNTLFNSLPNLSNIASVVLQGLSMREYQVKVYLNFKFFVNLNFF